MSVVYYTSNFLDDKNPYFLENTRKQLLKAVGDMQIILVSQKETPKIGNNCVSVVVGDIGRSHLNIYRQILTGAKIATTRYIAMAEDDILYSDSHFHPEFFVKPEILNRKCFFYDMNKLSLFTWSKPPMFSFRSKRKVVNQLIADRQYLIDALEERFAWIPKLKEKGWSDERIWHYWGDPGRYEVNLGVTVRETYEWYSWRPSIVFSHELAHGFLIQGKRKKLGDIRIIEVADWGRAEDVLKLYDKNL